MSHAFLPIARMLERANRAREESDTAYFFELMYLGEFITKLIVLELVSALKDGRDRDRYILEYRIVRANGIGEWVSVLDEVLTGPASQHLIEGARESQTALAKAFGPGDESWQRRAVDHLSDAMRCVDSECEDLTRVRASMRRWASSFAALRNRTRGHGAPTAETLSRVCPQLEHSLMEIIENAPVFSRSWVHLKRSMSGKYRVSVLGGEREPFSFLTKERGHSLPEGVYAHLGAVCRVPLLRTDADLTDFWLPNGNFSGTTFESLSYITDRTRTEDGSDWLLPAEAQPASETGANPQLDVIGNTFTNMPPRASGYIPRPELESSLSKVLLDERNPVVTLHGRGGVGKTSVALEVLHRLADSGEFFAIVWFSARDIDLLPEGPRVVHADVLSTGDIAQDFSRLFMEDSAIKPAVSLKYFTECLSGKADDGPFLFVFDNFETIRDQDELYAYINNAVRLPNKILITTRTRDFKADYPVEVGGMERSEYRALVEETALRLNISSLIDPGYFEALYEESDGHPYITKVLLGEMARSGRATKPKMVVAAKEAMLNALFDRSYAALSPAGQRVFLTLCSWRSLVPKVGLFAVMLRPGNDPIDVAFALNELAQASLVEERRDPHDGSVFLSVPLAAALFGKKKLVTSPYKIVIDADVELVRGFGASSTTDMTQGLGPRIDRWIQSVVNGSSSTADSATACAVLQYIASEYSPAWLGLARLQADLGDTESSIDSLNRYLEENPQDQRGWRQLAGTYRSCGNTGGELHARLQLAELPGAPFEDVSQAANRLNSILTSRELDSASDEKVLLIRRLRRLMEDRHLEATATDLSRLAWLCMHEHDTVAAEKWALEGLQLDSDNVHCLRLAERVRGSDVK